MQEHLTHAASLPQFPVRKLDAAIEALIECRNAFDGDPDEETVDAFGKHPDDEPDDHPDPAWPEWDTRGRHKKAEFGRKRRRG